MMKEVRVTAYYYDGRQYGSILVPDELHGDDAKDYICDHIDDVKFDDADFMDLENIDIFEEAESEKKSEPMRSVNVTAFPYAVQYGDIEVPANLSDDEVKQYIQEHWDAVKFSEPDLDYCGTDFEIE